MIKNIDNQSESSKFLLSFDLNQTSPHKMKPIVLIAGLSFMALSVSAQTQPGEEEKSPLMQKIINELYISANRTILGNRENSERWGYGLGANHSFHLGKKVEYLLGVEYTHASVFQSDILLCKVPSCSSSSYSIIGYRYTLDCLSFPTGFRYNFGRKYPVFFDHGVILGLKISDEMMEVRKYVSSQTTGAGRTRDYANSFIPGVFLGMGVRIPGTHVEYLVHSTFRLMLASAPLGLQWKLDVGLKWR